MNTQRVQGKFSFPYMCLLGAACAVAFSVSFINQNENILFSEVESIKVLQTVPIVRAWAGTCAQTGTHFYDSVSLPHH